MVQSKLNMATNGYPEHLLKSRLLGNEFRNSKFYKYS